MDNELSYYEVEMGYLKDGADDIEYESPFTLCISTLYFPDTESIIALCKKELDKDYDYVHSITRISDDEQAEMFSDITYRLMSEDEYKEVRKLIKKMMSASVSDDYLESILETVDHETDESFVDSVIDDIKSSSGWRTEGYFSNDDVRLSIGRELMARIGTEI